MANSDSFSTDNCYQIICLRLPYPGTSTDFLWRKWLSPFFIAAFFLSSLSRIRFKLARPSFLPSLMKIKLLE